MSVHLKASKNISVLLFLCFIGAVPTSLQAGAMASEVKNATQSLQKGAETLKEGVSSLLPQAENKKYKRKWMIADLSLNGFVGFCGIIGLGIAKHKTKNLAVFCSWGLFFGSIVALIVRLILLAVLKAKNSAQKTYKKKTLWHLAVSICMIIVGAIIGIGLEDKMPEFSHYFGIIPNLIGMIGRFLIYLLIPIR